MRGLSALINSTPNAFRVYLWVGRAEKLDAQIILFIYKNQQKEKKNHIFDAATANTMNGPAMKATRTMTTIMTMETIP